MADPNRIDSPPEGQFPIWLDRETFNLLHKIAMLPPQSVTRVLRVIEVEPENYQFHADPTFTELEWKGLINRFMTHVDTQTNPNGCWVWTGSVGDEGYGFFSIGWKKGYRAHRAAWLLFKGGIPKGQQVLHRCDNRPCVNPEHLYLGTHTENMADRLRKGRTPKGGGKKVTEQDVVEIRRLYALGEHSQKQLSKMFGVNKRSISAIINRKTWSHV